MAPCDTCRVGCDSLFSALCKRLFDIGPECVLQGTADEKEKSHIRDWCSPGSSDSGIG